MYKRQQQRQIEQVIAAETRLKVAEIDFRTAQADAQARLNAAEAERRVIAERNQREAEVLKRQILAYGGGENFVRAMLYAKLMPGIGSIVSNSAGGGLFGLPFGIPANTKGGAQ